MQPIAQGNGLPLWQYETDEESTDTVDEIDFLLEENLNENSCLLQKSINS